MDNSTSQVLTNEAKVTAVPEPPRRSLWHRALGRPEFGSLMGAVAIYVIFFAIAPPFRDLNSFATVLYASSTIGLMAVPVCLLMIGGEFDLSAGVAVTTASLSASMFAYQLNVNVWLGVLFSLVLMLVVGFVNGYLVVRTRIPSFLITLGMFLMLQGLNLAITKLITGNVATSDISQMNGFRTAEHVFAYQFSIGSMSGIFITVPWWLLFVALGSWVLLRTRAGNWIFAVGGNAASARAVGVPVARTKIGLFMAVSFFAWFTGMHLLFEFNTVQSGDGVGNELLYIIAAVIGGCLLTGGYGTVAGAAIGAFIFGMVNEGIVYAGWDPNWFKFFLGIMLLFATLINAWVRRLAARR